MCWNVQGLKQKLFNNDFIEYCKSFDIFSLSEIHNCNKNDVSKVFDNYEVYLSHREHFKGGGVGVLVKKHLTNYLIKTIKGLHECITLRFKKSLFNTEKDVILCFPYIAHEFSTVFQNSVQKGIGLLEGFAAKVNEEEGDILWVIGGDCNARTGTISDCILYDNIDTYLPSLDGVDNFYSDLALPGRQSRDPHFTNNYGRQLTQMCLDNGLCMLNGRTKGDETGNITCIANKGKTIVDYLIISKDLYCNVMHFFVTPRPESDHFPIYAEFVIDQTTHTAEAMSDEPDMTLTPIIKTNWNEADKYTYRETLEYLSVHEIDDLKNRLQHSVDEGLELVYNIIKRASNSSSKTRRTHCTHMTAHAPSQPLWWDNECDSLKRQKYKYLRLFHKTNRNDDLDLFLKSRNTFKQVCKQKKADYTEQKLLSLTSYFDHNKSALFWKNLKAMIGTYQVPQPQNISTQKWFDYFKDLYNPNINDSDEAFNYDTEDTLIELAGDFNSHITAEEVRQAIKKLKKGKAAGSDGLGAEFYSNCGAYFIECLVNLFDHIFESGDYPEEWAKALIYPLYKKGSKSDVNNYRGISLLNVIAKLYSSVLHNRLSKVSEEYQLIPASQAGFRKGYSTIDNIFCLQSLIQKYLSKKRGRFYVLFVDFSKAFDSVDRDRLWYILEAHGISGKLLKGLKSMYSTVKCAVRVDKSNATDLFECTSGVKQGCILSPLLFTLFISELDEHMRVSGMKGTELLTNDERAFSLMYADDLCLLSDNVIDMQRKIDQLESFCTKWKMNVNLSKTKMMVFRNGGILKQSEKWRYQGKPVEVTTYYSYLGLIFSSRLIWSKCLRNLIARTNALTSKMRKICNRYQNVKTNLLFNIFDVKLKPILMYGAEIWGVERHDIIEQSQIRYCKMVLNVGKTTTNCTVLKDCGRYHLFVDYHYKAIKFWTRLLSLDNSRYAKKTYLQLFAHDQNGRSNWVSAIRKLICSLGFGLVWMNQSSGDIGCWLNEIKDRLKGWSTQELNSQIRKFNPLLLDYHPDPFAAPYLSILKSYEKRRIFSMLRSKSLRLKNNLYRLKLSSDNLCNECMEVEDEYHFIFECMLYNNFRKEIIAPIIVKDRKSVHTLYILLNSSNECFLNAIVSFVKAILKIRNDLMSISN